MAVLTPQSLGGIPIEAAAPGGSLLSPSRPFSARLLVADDDRISRDVLAAMLRSYGHDVDVVEDGQLAVERVARGGIDLVLLDVMMPRLSGLNACRLIKTRPADEFLPVLLVTVKTDTQSRVDGLKTGADDYVCKPFDEPELIARVDALLRMKRLHDHLLDARRRLERMSMHDELTGTYNYRYLHTRLAEEFKRAERYHDPVACVLVDIDQLQIINDRAGRSVGDAILRQLAETIRRSVRDVDVLARFGGDEFLLILPHTHFSGAVAVAERIWREVQSRGGPFESANSGASRPTVSLGIALFPSRDVRSKDALLRSADGALFQAKREGGNRICVFQQQGYIYTPSPTEPLFRPPGRGSQGDEP